MGKGLQRAFAYAAATNLTKTERLALSDCAKYPDGFFWRPKTMEKLAAKGLAESFVVEAGPFKGSTAYRLSDVGRAAIA